jgi:integrase
MSNSTHTATFAHAAVADAKGATPYDQSELLRAVLALVEWSNDFGVAIDRPTVFARDNIVAHISHGLSAFGQGTRTNRRSQLLRIAEALLEPALAPRALPALAPSDPTVPYSKEEQTTLLEWARKRKRTKRCDDAMMLLALGFGAGLSAQEVMNVRADDVTDTGEAVLVHVTEGRVRVVPVLRKWEKALARRAADLKPTEHLFKPGRTGAGKNLISNFVAAAKADGVHAQTQRMRSTWLVQQMAACTPLPALVDAAGVDSLEALTRYLAFVPAAHDANAVARLRAA